MSSTYVGTFCGGSVLFRPLSYYRILEVATGDRRIGDRTEGVLRWTKANSLAGEDSGVGNFKLQLDVTAGTLGMSGGPKLVAYAQNPDGFAYCRGGSPSITYTQITDGYAFCFSKGELDKLWLVMCDPADVDPYDAAIEILDLQSFIWHLYFTGEFRIGSQPLMYVRDVFRLEWSRVQYRTSTDERDDRPVSEKVPLLAGGKPFVKGMDYESQSEWRIVLYPNTPLDLCSLLITVPNITHLIQVRQSSPVSDKPSNDNTEKDMRDFREIFAELSVDGEFGKISESTESLEEVYRKVARVYLAAYLAGVSDYHIDFMMKGIIYSQGPLVLPIPAALYVVRHCIDFMEKQAHPNT